jgi:hypothetical protein
MEIMDTKIRTKLIRKELAILISKKQEFLNSDKERNNAINIARQEINTKYGNDWRELY